MNRTKSRAEGIVTDLQYGATLEGSVTLDAGEYGDLHGADLVIITVGINEKAGGATERNDEEGRLRLLKNNAAVYQSVVPAIVTAAPEAVLLVLTDPPDPLAELTRQLAGHDCVICSGTFLDTQRLRFHIAQHLAVHPRAVQGLVLGGHGMSEVFVWSGVRVSGIPLAELLDDEQTQCNAFYQEIEEKVRHANITIIEGIGASQYGIGIVAARLVKAILRDERVMLPVGTHSAEYGTTLSVPSVIGCDGVLRHLKPSLSEHEAYLLQQSAKKIAAAVKNIVPSCESLRSAINCNKNSKK